MRRFALFCLPALFWVLVTSCRSTPRQEADVVTDKSRMDIATFIAREAVITARRDGWVEVRQHIRHARTLDQDEYFLPREYYRPAEIRAWAIRALATADTARVGRSQASVDSLGKPPQHILITGTTHRTVQPDGRWGIQMSTNSWATDMHGCGRSLTWRASNFSITRPQGAPDREFIAKLDSAASIAAAARTNPVAQQLNGPFNQSELSCITAPYSPTMPTRITSERDPVPLEVLARFIVTRAGLVDTASVEFYPTLNRALHRKAISAMQAWRVTGLRAGEAVDFRMHHPVIFFDSVHSDNRSEVSGFAAAYLLTLRKDGLLEQRVGLLPGGVTETGYFWSRTASVHAINSREVFRVSDVKRWITDVTRMRDLAVRLPPGSDVLPDYGESRRAGSPWLVYLGDPAGRRMIARFFRDGRPAANADLDLTACGSDSLASAFVTSILWDQGLDQWNYMVRVVDSSLALNRIASIDSNRVYGELEVTCVATPHDSGLPSRATRETNLETVLALHEDALVSFVVNRFGTVDRASIHVMGKWRASDRRKIAAAISGLRYTPATFAGIRVAQRAHYLIPASRELPGRVTP